MVGPIRGGSVAAMIAVVPVRAGVLPAGGAETVAEAGGRALLIGEGTEKAVADLGALAGEVTVWETDGFHPGRWAGATSGLLSAEPIVLLPASPDGRDLAPRIAVVTGHDLLCGALDVRDGTVHTSYHGGSAMLEHHLDGATVITLQPGVRGIDPTVDHRAEPARVTRVHLDEPDLPEARTVEVLPPDASTMDLAEAPRIVAGGNGLSSEERFGRLGDLADALDASVGTTRVITDKGWLPHERQIGTTGVVVDPRLYVAFGISGAVQHTSGLGQPDHIVSVNTDPHCPMMSLADLAVVADADATLDELCELLAGSGNRNGGRNDGSDGDDGTTADVGDRSDAAESPR